MGNYPKKEDVASNLRSFRELRKMSQKELATRLGVSPNCIYNWENCVSCPSLENQFEMCEILDISITDLFGMEPSESLTPAERVLIRKYRMLDKRGVSTVNTVLDVQYQQSVRREAPEEQLHVLASRLV